MLLEQLIVIGGRTTVTVKLQLVVVPQLSVAVLKTVFVPMGKVLPLGGMEFIIGGLHPPLAPTLKYTVVPPLLVAFTTMLLEQSIVTGGRVTVTVKVQLVVVPQLSLAKQ